MTVFDTDYFKTLHPDGRSGVRMKASLYSAIKAFVLHILENEREILFSTFVQKVYDQFINDLGENTGWFLYHVKLDMETRGLIKHDRRTRKGARQSMIKLLPQL